MDSDYNSFEHPATEQEIIALVKRARAEKRKVRVRGAGHSVDQSIYAPDGINVMLDRYRAITFDVARMRVTVQAGCHLGRDPYDPAGTSTWDNSLLRQLDEKGWALSNLGGITHQTISGFSSTGSAGGSLRHSFRENVVGVCLIDGRGMRQEYWRDRDPEFAAASLGLGILGVVSTITLQCENRFDIIGREIICKEDNCEIDLFGDRANSLQHFLQETEYARLLWWPQKGVRKVVVWQARRMDDQDYDEQTGPREDFKPRRYRAFGENPRLTQKFAYLFYSFIGNLRHYGLIGRVVKKLLPLLLPLVVNIFVKEDKDGPQRFWDWWWRGLPMDNEADDKLVPTEFTEMWIPISKTQDVMRKLRKHYREHGLSATGTYLCEIYAAKRTDAWLSPAFEQDMVRFDMFWFARNAGDPVTDYYPQFWELLKEFDYRLHWGKHVPDNPSLPQYFRSRYPRWDDFMKLRAELDPDQIFLTDYWRTRLGVPAAGGSG